MAPTYFVRMNSSKITASVNFVRIRTCWSRSSFKPMFRVLHPPLQPITRLQVVDMHELGADGPAIGVFKPFDDLPQCLDVRAANRSGGNAAIQIGFRKSVVLRVQLNGAWSEAGLTDRLWQ